MNRIISPSMLSADFGNLDADIEMINNSAAQWFHLDIMDGVFVPNISYGFPIIQHINKKTDKILDVHLMIVRPEQYFADFKAAGADYLTVHYEASTHLHRSLNAISQLGMKAGIALNPHTPVSMLEEVITEADMVLIMSVNPGFGGQQFIVNSIDKIRRTKELILRKNAQTLIQVDGGVNLLNAKTLFDAGCDVLVAGNAIFSSDNPAQYIDDLLRV